MKSTSKIIAALVTASLIGANSALSRQPAGDPPPGDAFAELVQPDPPPEGTPRPGGHVGQRQPNEPNGFPGPKGGEGGPGLPGGQGGAGSSNGRQYGDRLQSIIRRSPSTGQTKSLILRPADGDPVEQSALEEDLAVMLRVLDKTAEERGGGPAQRRNAMGIDVAFPGTGAIRSLYLDGYGALFIVNVGFPLQPPPLAKPREERPPADSSWEEAKRELHTPGPDTMMARSPGEEFDQEKATRLEDALLDALKNASHIRGLKSDDSITICVLGGGVPLPMRNGPKGEPDPFFDRAEAGGFPGAGNQGGSRATTLTLRVKKADVEALAKGKLATSDFRKRASITTGIGPVTGGMPFSGTFFGGGFGGSGGGGGFGGSSGGGGGNRP